MTGARLARASRPLLPRPHLHRPRPRTVATGSLAVAGSFAALFLVIGAGAAGASTGAKAATRIPTAALAPQAPSAAATPPIGTPAQATELITNPSLGTGTGTNANIPSAGSIGDIASPKAPAAPSGPAEPQGGTVTVGVTGVTGKPSQSLSIILLLTVISVAPALLVLCTSFTKIMVVLSLARNALGLQSIPPNQVLAGLSLFLSLFIMGPVLSKVNHDGIQPYLHGTKTESKAFADGSAPLKTWMLAQTRKDDLGMLTRLAAESKAKAAQNPDATTTATGATPPTAAAAANPSTAAPVTGAMTASSTERVSGVTASSVALTTLVPAFVLSELKSAFIIGFAVFIPFLVIDLVVSSSLMSMGMAMVPPVTVSLPFKLLLFLMVDGWGLIVQSLITSYH